MDLPHYRFAALGTKTYGELAEEQAVPVDLALDVVASAPVAARRALHEHAVTGT
jgi:hypothetical protein